MVASDGVTVTFDASSLDMMDRIGGVFLSGTLSQLLGSSSAGVSTAEPLDKGSLHSAARLKVSQIKDLLDKIGTVAGLTSAAAAVEASDTSRNSVATRLFDDTTALVGGVMGFMSSTGALPTAAANLKLGVMAALVSDVHITTNAFVDDFTYLGASVFGNQALKDAVIEDLTQNSGHLKQALTDLVVVSPFVQNFRIAG